MNKFEMSGLKQQIAESESALLDILADKFGNDIVFSKDENYIVTVGDLTYCFDIANDILFDGKLERIPIYVVDNSNNPTTLAQISIGWKYADSGLHEFDSAFIDVSDFSKNFFTILCALVHEMIHAYDAIYDGKIDFAKKAYLIANNKLTELKKLNDHNASFVRIMNEINRKYDLDVKIARTNMKMNFPTEEEEQLFKRIYNEVKDKLKITAKEKIPEAAYRKMLEHAVKWCYVHSAGTAKIDGNAMKVIFTIT